MASSDEKPGQVNWASWILLGVALGGPLAGLGSFKEWALQHPWLALLATLIYEVLLVLVALIKGVWKRLETPWLDGVAKRLDFQVQCAISGHRKKYLRHLSAECHDIDVKGLTTQGAHALALQQVFVELEVEPTPPSAVASEPAPQLPPRLASGRHNLWDYLEANRNLAVIGGPGCGKTTMLRHVALLVSTQHASLRRTPVVRRLPVLLFLRNHAKTIVENPELALSDAIEQGEIAKEQEEQAPKGWWDDQIRRDRCLVLLDGLDEVADPETRRKVVVWVERIMRRHAGNVFVTTSRPGAYRESPLSGVTVLGVRPLSSPQQEAFVSNWYLANEMASRNAADPRADELARKAAAKGSRDLMKRVRNSGTLNDLAVNPLLLTMIATVHRFRSELPGRRVELYREICDVFLGKRQAVRGVEDPAGLTPQQKQSVLEPLAYQLMLASEREVDLRSAVDWIRMPLEEVNPALKPAWFLKVVEDTSGLVVESEPGIYRFAHKTFQEYLAAVHIRNQGLVESLTGQVEVDWWHETIRLYVADADATPVFRACLDRPNPTTAAFVLAAECLEEAKTVKPEYRLRAETLFRSGVEYPATRTVCAEALLALRLRKLKPTEVGREIDSGLVSNAEYQLFIDSSRAQGKDTRPHHWKLDQLEFAPGTGMLPVTGLDSSRVLAFCNWLSERTGVSPRYHLPQVGEMGETDEEARYFGWWTVAAERVSIEGILPPVMETYEDYILHLARGLIRATDPAIAFASILASNLDRARMLASDLASGLVRVLDRVRVNDLVGVLDRASDRAGYFDRASPSASCFERDLASALASDRDRDLASVLDRSRAVARAIARDLTNARNLARDLDRSIARALDRDLERTSNLISNFDLASDLGLASALEHASDLASDLERALDNAHSSDLALAFLLILAQSPTVRPKGMLASKYDSYANEHSEWGPFSRSIAQLLFEAIRRWNQHDLVRGQQALDSWSRAEPLAPCLWGRLMKLLRRNPTPGSHDSWLGTGAHLATDAFVQLAIIQGVREGQLPSYGGIRLVRERAAAPEEEIGAKRANA